MILLPISISYTASSLSVILVNLFITTHCLLFDSNVFLEC